MNKTEWEACIETYGKDIYSFCCYLTRNRQEADDLYQDTFLKAVELDRGRTPLDEGKNPKSYLLAIAVRLWNNRKRKLARRQRIADVSAMEEREEILEDPNNPAPEDVVISAERLELVRRAVDRLPDKMRTVVLLFYMEQCSVEHIAALLHLPHGTVKSRLSQARKRLGRELEDLI